MATEKSVVIELPKEEFQAFAGSFEESKAKSLTDAFTAATAELDRKESRNAFVRYFDLEGGYGAAQIAGADDAWVTVDKDGAVEIDMGESDFKKHLTGVTSETGKGLSAAFDAAASDMARKEARNAIVNYFDLNSQASTVAVEPAKNMTLSLVK